MSKHKKKLKIAFSKKNIKQAVLSVFYNFPQRTYNYKQLAAVLNIEDKEVRNVIIVALDELLESGKLQQIRRGKYQLKSSGRVITGKVELQPQGFAHIISEESEEPVLVSQKNLNHAMEGDIVKISLYAHRKKHSIEGEVAEVIKRAKTSFVGILQSSRNYAFLVPVGKVGFDLFIPSDKLNGAKDGQKVIGQIIEWPAKAKNPFGKVITVLGNSGENETEMNAILAEYNLPLKFPANVEKAANEIPKEINDEEIKSRRDMRDVTTFTIDPADAKDFDDALSIRKIDDSLWEIGIHIADVSHYMKQDSILDKEAYKRATSIYLVDRVVPMLPEVLSNGVCSLRPNEDKLCFSAIFKISNEGDVSDQWIGRTVINSNRRFNYGEVQDIIDSGEGDLKDDILIMNAIAKKLRAKRFSEGSISFERVEVKFKLDDKGKPLSVYFKESGESNHLVEEYMLLANKKVAEFVGKKPKIKRPKTFVYRIHDRPDSDKLEGLNHFIKNFGYEDIKTTNPRVISKSINALMDKVKGKVEENVVSTLAIRTMARAEYSTRNIGHYGLGFEYYTHFTSPIRRYPDVMVHRLIARYLDGERSVSASKYEEYCKHSSEMEVLATKAERSSIKYKQVEFMQDKIGESYTGIISGVTDWGIYVELENKCEGMVPIRELDDDFYTLDEKNYCLVGKHNHKTYQLGQTVKIEVLRANLDRKQLDFKLIE